MNGKRGSSAVFLTMIFPALVIIALALIYGAREAILESKADGVIGLAGDSVLSEFDNHIQKEYGLFMMKGDDRYLTEKLRDYVLCSFDKEERKKIQKLRASGKRFAASNTEEIRGQIKEYMKYAMAQGLFEEEEKEALSEQRPARTLRHGPTKVSLPSGAVPEKDLAARAKAAAENAASLNRAFQKGTDSYIINRYILSHFSTRVSDVNEKSFFRSEAEYILSGEYSDEDNEKKAERIIKAMRTPLNLAHIYADADKRNLVITAAQLITPGGAAAATQLALASAWAYAEADNDVRLLLGGRKVPLIKDSSTWAVELDSVIDKITGKTVYPEEERGYGYEGYMQMMLFLMDDELKTARILDLIQINMRKNHYGDFLIQEYVTGIHIEAEVNGRDFGYEKKY